MTEQYTQYKNYRKIKINILEMELSDQMNYKSMDDVYGIGTYTDFRHNIDDRFGKKSV